MKARSETFTRRRLFIGAGGMASVLALAACGAMPAATTEPAMEEKTEAKAEEKPAMMETPVINIDEYFTETDGSSCSVPEHAQAGRRGAGRQVQRHPW